MQSHLLIGAVCVACLIPGCSQQPQEAKTQDAVVGKWQVVVGEDTVEFTKDGNVTFVVSGRPVSGKYKFEKENVLKVEWASPILKDGFQTQATIQHVKVSAEELATNDPSGTSRKYKRAK